MKVIIEKDDGTQSEVAVGQTVVVGGIEVSVREYKEPTFYDPATLFPGTSGGDAA